MAQVNPFDVDGEHDLLHAPPEGVAGWSETMYFSVWNPDAGVGVWIHTGRCPEDPDLWWAQTAALLPDGALLMDMSWGRPVDRRGPSTGNLTVRCEEPLTRWTLSFDGAGEATTTERTAQGPVGAGPCLPFAFDVELNAISPVWDMDRALGITDLSWAHMHHEQAFRTTGELRVGERSWRLDGVGFRDHSHGPRDFTSLGGDHFFNVVSPTTGRVAHGLVNWRQDGSVDHRTFATYSESDGYQLFATGSMIGLQDPVTHSPRGITVHVGDDLVLTGEVLHGLTVSLIEPNININGLAAFHPDPLVLTESMIRLEWPDGDVAYGMLERDYRSRLLPSPEAR
ncbi:hypothetical protein [Nocardioides sp. WS12]|uniref:hypothetical protein n=1 Tax=Nocardioides sp. WS12 TaxID=2486272 RepID=UPI00191D9A02|nr:hypothetical protein [Nocardioides sp. WS12]